MTQVEPNFSTIQPMKSRTSLSLHSAALAILFNSAALGQGVVNSGTISASVTLTNPPGAVVTRLTSVGGPQLRNHYAQAAAVPPPGVASANRTPSSPTASTLAFAVDSTGSPSWVVRQRLDFEIYGEQLNFPDSAALPLAPNGTISPAVSAQVSIVDFTFSQAIAGGTIRVYPTGNPGQTLAETAGLPAGITRCEFVVPTGQPLVIELGLDVGTGGALGNARRVSHVVTTWNAGAGVPVNQVLPVAVNLSTGAGLGAITGTFDILGETEASLTSSDVTIGGYSVITAQYVSARPLGAADWKRRTVIAGAPSSGAFTLGNLTPTSAIPLGDLGYTLQAEAWLKRTLPGGQKAAQWFRTGVHNPFAPINVPNAGSVNIGNVFQIQPGSVEGNFTLYGPPAVAGQPALLSGVLSAAAFDTDDDGLPDAPLRSNPAAWLDRSGISMSGELTAANPAYGGIASQILEHTYSGTTLTAPFKLALGGNSSATSTWNSPVLRLLMTSNNSSSADQYFNTDYNLRNRSGLPLSIEAGASHITSLAVDMGEVCLTLRSAAGSGTQLFTPEIRWYENGLTEDPGNLREVQGIRAFGFPVSAATAAPLATLRTLLPAGTYTLRPTVGTVSGGGQIGATSTSPITITVPAQGRVCVDNGLAITAVIPRCIGAAAQLVNGSVNSNGVKVTSITYRIDGGEPFAATVVGQFDPTYSFTLPAGLSGGDHTVTVTVTTVDDRTASFSQQVTVDEVKPTITCPANMNIYPEINQPQVVQYFSPTFSDNCPGVSVICNPPSGAAFPMGTTTVTCTATDAVGNSASCTFTITLHPPCPPPIRSHSFSAIFETYFRYTDVPAWHSNVAMTIEAWVRHEFPNACETIISQNYLNSFWFGICQNKLRFYRSGGLSADSTVTVPTGQWTHVAVTYDGTTAKFYIDGEFASSQLLGNAGTGNNDLITIGADFTEGDSEYPFAGHIDELRIYNRELGPSEMNFSPIQQYRTGPDLAATFGTGGSVEDLSGATPLASSVPAPQPQIEGMLPKWLVIPQVAGVNGVDGEVDPFTEYANADKMVIRYSAGATGVRDAIAYFNYHNQPGDRALYIGVKGVRDVIAPWTRGQSWVAVQFDPGIDPSAPPGAPYYRFNSRRLDGTFNPGPTPTGYEIGLLGGNYGPLPPGDPLISAPTPFGLIGAGGDTVEFRFDLSVLGGDWQKRLRLGLSHHWISGVGQDFGAPVGSAYDNPFGWAHVVFSGIMPKLQVERGGNLLGLSWADAGCNFTLERSTNLTPTSWTNFPAPRNESIQDGLFREAIVDMSLQPREFFRLRR
jgi:hypothetical protein